MAAIIDQTARKFNVDEADGVSGRDTIVGILNYEPWAVQRALAFVEANLNKYPFDEVISQVYPLDRINEAFREAEWLGRQNSHGISRAGIAP
jgi:D-arabinose 1-dehydrogenase-like Zn-dependent alcohol dehydrogenase